MNPLVLGVVGCGQAGRGHLQSCLSNPRVAKVIGVETNPANAETTRAQFDVEVVEDYRPLLEQPEVAAVIIAASNQVHATISIDALSAGKHVLCEKPMALHEDEARQMVKAAREGKRTLHIGFELRNSVLPLRVMQVLQSGEIGDPVSFQMIHYRGAFCPEWKGRRDDGGSMFLMETCHVLDLFRWWSGDEVESVVALGPRKVIPYYEFHDTDFTTFLFRGGAVGHVVTCHTRSANPEVWTDEIGYSEPFGHQYEFSITGTKGALHFRPLKGQLYVMEHDPPGGASFTQSLKRTEDLSHLPMHKLIHDTATEVDNFIDAVCEGRDTNLTPEDALNTHLVCYAGQQALDTGEKVRVGY